MKNKISDGFKIPFTAAADLSAGAPAVVGVIPGVVSADVLTGASGTLDTHGVFDLSAKGIDGLGDSAIAAGDQLYYTAGDTPKLNKKTTGTPFGVALEAVAGGATGTINVKIGH